jgi:hypothetical protein
MLNALPVSHLVSFAKFFQILGSPHVILTLASFTSHPHSDGVVKGNRGVNGQ